MYMVTTLPAKVPGWALQILSLNPPAVSISLVRVALLKSYRTNSPGNAPYNRLVCDFFHSDPGGKHCRRRPTRWCRTPRCRRTATPS